MIFGDWVLLKLQDPMWCDEALCLIDYVDAECGIGGLTVDDVRAVLARTGDDGCTALTNTADPCDCESCAVLDVLVYEWECPDDSPIIPRSVALHRHIPSGPGVYFLRDGDLVKVGVASDVRGRFSTHRSSNLRIFMVAVVRGCAATEALVHEQLRPLLIPGEREWFTYGPAVDDVLHDFGARGDLLWTMHQ